MDGGAGVGGMHGFVPTATGALCETAGLWFEAFAPGQKFIHRPGLTISQRANVEDALLTLNQAMIHFDEHYAAASEFERPLVVSTLTLQAAIGLSWKTYGRRRRVLGFSSIKLTATVFGGDTIYARSSVLETSPLPDDPECGAVRVAFTMHKPDGMVVAELDCRLAIFRASAAQGLPAAFGSVA